MSGKIRNSFDWFSRRLNLSEIFSLLTSYGLFYAEIDTRKPLTEALAEVREQPTPSYTRWPRILSLVVVVLLAIEVVTGGLLALYYLPTPDSAHESLGTILRDVHFGDLVHHVHYWAAQLLIATLILRVIMAFVRRSYRVPRELIWVFSTLLLLVCLHLDLTGRALPMTEPGYWSTVRALEIADSVPIYGSLLLFLLGSAGTVITDLTLIRFYVFHVAVLPLAALALVYFHFSSIRRVGLMVKEGEVMHSGKRAYRGHLVNLAILLTILFGIVVSFSVLLPPRFQPAADPFQTLPGVAPAWYLLALFGFLEWTSGFVPTWLAGSFLFVMVMVFLAVPFLDRKAESSRSRLVTLAIGAVILIVWALFTVYGARVA